MVLTATNSNKPSTLKRQGSTLQMDSQSAPTASWSTQGQDSMCHLTTLAFSMALPSAVRPEFRAVASTAACLTRRHASVLRGTPGVTAKRRFAAVMAYFSNTATETRPTLSHWKRLPRSCSCHPSQTSSATRTSDPAPGRFRLFHWDSIPSTPKGFGPTSSNGT